MAFANAFNSVTPNLTSAFTPRRATCCKNGASSSAFSVIMKAKREKRARSSSTSESPHSKPASSPPRIGVESSTLSLRQQLKLARASTQDPVAPRVRQRFRRKKDLDVRSGRSRGEDDVNLPDGKYSWERDPIMFIDAYNVIGAWPKLRKHRDKMDLETARRLLFEAVAEFSHVRGWECVLVFDAQGNDDAEKTTDTPEMVQVVYTGAETADTYIERHVYQMCEQGGRQVWAATSDVAQLRFSRAKGAHVMTSHLFVQEVKRALRETRERVEQTDGMAARGRMLQSTVDEYTRKRLLQLRDQLNGT